MQGGTIKPDWLVIRRSAAGDTNIATCEGSWLRVFSSMPDD